LNKNFTPQNNMIIRSKLDITAVAIKTTDVISAPRKYILDDFCGNVCANVIANPTNDKS